MAEYLEKSLQSFRSCFFKERAFRWFVLVILMFILREDHLGVTSTIRALSLNHGCYDTLIHFFHSSAYQTQMVRLAWYRFVRDSANFLLADGRTILIGDGVKQSKEARYMPGVKKLHQESEDSSKGEYIFGHMFGAIGVLIGIKQHHLCLPLHMSIQDGLRDAAGWENSGISAESHVVQIIRNAYDAARTLGRSFLILDRYFLTVPAISAMNELNSSDGGNRIAIITKAKRNVIAYRQPIPTLRKTRGRPRKKGTPVKLNDLFDSKKSHFETEVMYLYGRKRTVRHMYLDLLWGTKLYQELRFVLVEYEDDGGPKRGILVCTEKYAPNLIITLYAYRFSIEEYFREFKQRFGGFGYHFWTRSIAKLNHFKKKDEPDRLSHVKDPAAQKKILNTVDAIERFVLFAEIAMGLVQLMTYRIQDVRKIQDFRYVRTQRDGYISEATLLYYLRHTFLGSLLSKPESLLTRYISALQAHYPDEDLAA